MGPQLLLQTALYSRIGIIPISYEGNRIILVNIFPGVTHLAWLSSEVFRQCYRNSAPFEDYLKSTFRSCQLVS